MTEPTRVIAARRAGQPPASRGRAQANALRQSLPCRLVRRQPEAQPIRRLGEGAREYACAEQRREALGCVGPRSQAKQPRSADHRPSRRHEQPIEPLRLGFEAGAHRLEPGFIGERPQPHLDRGPADGPWTERGAQRAGEVGRRDREAQPETRQAVSLAERAQHDRAAFGQIGREALVGRVEIRERLVDDQHARRHAPRKRAQRSRFDDPPVRVVGIDDNRDVASRKIFDPVDANHLRAPSPRMPWVGRPEHADAARGQ